MATETQVDDRAALAIASEFMTRMLDFDSDTRRRMLIAAESVLLGTHPTSAIRSTGQSAPQATPTQSVRATNFAREELPPKDFLFQKQPQTDVERVACLAYYLRHYRDRPHFKTVDISLLNTEAAQVKFSNAAFAVANAANLGFLASAGKGAKQLSAQGERYVAALPDRTAAKELRASIRTRRGRKKGLRNNKESEK